MNEDNILAYTAGLIDGEGSICLNKQHKNEHRSPVISVTSTSKELLDFLKSNFEGTIVNQKVYKEHYKPAWIWCLCRHKAIVFLEKILPFMMEEEKKRKAKLIIGQYIKVTPRNGKYTPELLQKRIEFENDFFINSKVEQQKAIYGRELESMEHKKNEAHVGRGSELP